MADFAFRPATEADVVSARGPGRSLQTRALLAALKTGPQVVTPAPGRSVKSLTNRFAGWGRRRSRLPLLSVARLVDGSGILIALKEADDAEVD